jgi:oligopeptide transport system ATP-binding protein
LKSFIVARSSVGRPTRRFDAVRGVSLTVHQGETLAVVGESGAGKSTVGRLVLRLIEPDEGTIRLGETDVRRLSRRELRAHRSKMTMVFQDPFSSLNPTMTIGASVEEPLKLHTDLSGSDRQERVDELMSRVGLGPHHLDRFSYELSGGQLQRVAIARAIATQPDLVVCDEPVAALDVSIRAQVLNLLRDIQVERKIAYLFVSHDLSLVRVLAHRVIVMYGGIVAEEGPTDQIFAAPKHPYTQRLLAEIPVADPRNRQLLTTTPTAEVEAEPRDEPGCPFFQRCPSAHDECRDGVPKLRRAGGSLVSCTLYPEIPVDAPSASNEVRVETPTVR